MDARYWCHMCSQMVNPVMDAEIKCPHCDEGFLEEMSNDREERALSLWAPILFGMMGGGSSRRRRHHRREEFNDESDQDRELETVLRRRRRSSAALLHLLQGLRAESSTESNNYEGNREQEWERDRDRDRDRGRDRDRESVILINPFNQAIILQGAFSNNRNQSLDVPAGASLGDYFVGPGLELLLQRLAENDPNRYGTLPAQKEAVEAMPTVKIEECFSCPVCLEDIEIGTKAKEMPCNHRFHTGCILPWLELHSSCPVCRFQMPADESKASSGGTRLETIGDNRVETTAEGNAGGGEEGGSEGNDSRFWSPILWPFNGLFSSSGSQRNGNSGSSSSSLPPSRDAHHNAEN